MIESKVKGHELGSMTYEVDFGGRNFGKMKVDRLVGWVGSIRKDQVRKGKWMRRPTLPWPFARKDSSGTRMLVSPVAFAIAHSSFEVAKVNDPKRAQRITTLSFRLLPLQ